MGDTVGDPLKDTVGPCLDIFIKIMSTVSLVAVAVFARYNLAEVITRLFQGASENCLCSLRRVVPSGNGAALLCLQSGRC